MSALSIQPTYPIFTDIDGQPLEDGYVWIGTANLDPQTNPINAYWDAALTLPAAQPIRTLAGYPANSGTPARLYVNSDYSIRVMNKNGSVVYSAPAATERYSDVVVNGVNAEDVLYDPPFLGGVQTNVEAKLAQTVNVKDFGAVGDGSADDTVAIQAAIDALASGTVEFGSGTFVISANIALKSNVSLRGLGATLTFLTPYADDTGMLDDSGGAIENVTIDGIVFDGGGTWTNVQFANPYGGGNSVGFTNGQRGIALFNSSSKKVTIKNNTFTGLEQGVYTGACQDVLIEGNIFDTIGKAAIGASCVHSTISNNVIRRVLGNLTNAGVVSVAESKFADGIYFYGAQNVSVVGNVIEDCIRIGVVLEGDGVTLCSNVSISGNSLKNFNSCRGTEFNAAIWSEGGKTDYTCSATGNVCDNTGAVAGTNNAYGILGTRLTMTGNTITAFDIGITSRELRAFSNTIQNCGQSGIQLGGQLAGQTSALIGNHISNNGACGILIPQSRGTIYINGNTIVDNGQTTANPQNYSGIAIERYYNNQKVIIAGNTFISSADEGDTTGQLRAITGVAGGDFTRTTDWITNNQFIYTGTFTTPYPDNLKVEPCSFGYDNTSGTIFKYTLMPVQGNNLDGKMRQPFGDGDSDGYPYLVGYATAIPVSGTYRQGDYILNSLQTSGQPFGWVCTTEGTPGTWKIISTVS